MRPSSGDVGGDDDRGGQAGESYQMREWVDDERGDGANDHEMKHEADEGYGSVDSASSEDSGPAQTSHLRKHRRTGSVDTTASYALYTPDEERAVVRKFDRRLVLFVALLYLLSFLDRSNIGNARIAGLDADLQTTPPRSDWYAWALTAFYITYILFEPLALLWRYIPPHVFVTAIVLAWGIAASLQAVAPSYPVLIALRTLLGIGEAGFAGIPLYLSSFFRRDEMALRTAIFIAAAPLATSFAASLAWGILWAAEKTPIAPWRLLFLVEGFPSILVAIVAWRIIPDSPQTAPYLTVREKRVARLRLRNQNSVTPSSPAHSPSSKTTNRFLAALQPLLSPTALITPIMFFLTNMAYSSLPVFLPTILIAMGHTPLSSQALAAPPYLCAFIVVLAVARASDATKSRAPFVVVCALFSAIGYGILAGAEAWGLERGSRWRYAAVYPAAIGFFCVVVLLITWNLNNNAGGHGDSKGKKGKRRGHGGGPAFAMFQVIGQCGPLVGTRLYPDEEGPYYTKGMAVMCGAMLSVAILTLVLRWWLAKVNRGLEEMEKGVIENGEEEGLVAGMSRRRVAAGRPGFRYML